jgi:glucan 1,3-beta-glucosidase
MSFRKERLNSYLKSKLTQMVDPHSEQSIEELRDIFLELLHDKMHGICFSAYTEDQRPGNYLNKDQVEKRVAHLKPFTQWIRSFSCIEGNEFVPELAHKHGMKSLVGAWLGSDKDKNEEEIEGLIRLAKAGYVDVASVGNEVLYRGDLTEEDLIGYIQRVKEEIPHVPVGYVDAYYEFVQRPQLVDISDVLLINCYPFWEGTPFEYSLGHMQSMYHSVKNVSQGKRIIITETGWPSQGMPTGGAQPSFENSLRYFINTQFWVKENDIESFYFSSFDEDWKVDSEGDVGAFWGIWDKNHKLKY